METRSHDRIRWSKRQRQVLDLLVAGKSNKEIAEALGISLDGAKWHLREIFAKLGVGSREEAAAYWRAQESGVSQALRNGRALLAWLPKWALAAAFGAVAVPAAFAMLILLAPGRSGQPPATATPGSGGETAG